MSSVAYVKCGRCGGSGLYGDRGWCFRCAGAGSVVKDPFLRVIGVSGEFFGVTSEAVNGRRTKYIARAKSAADLAADMIGGYTLTPITEEQARAFFKRYGLSTEVAA